mgnify:FL=1|jgi:hypothetical protein
MNAKDLLPGYEQTLPVLSRPSAAAWAADPIHSPYAAPIHFDPNIRPVQTVASTPPAPPPPRPPPPTAPSRKTTTRVRKTRKNDNASAGKSTLFWVNSDQQTAAAGTTDETLKRIRSHVMSEHNRKKRMESTEQYNKSKWNHSSYQPPPTTPGALVPAEPPRPSISSSASLSTSQITDEQELEQVEEVVTSTAVGYPATQTASWDDCSFDGTMAYPARPSAWSYVGQGANDPFNTGHTQLTDRMMRHLRVCECPPF